jgi:hypothetical protein
MFAVRMTPEWMVWIAALSTPLHGRLEWRLATVVAGILFASGRRTASSWWRAARVGSEFRSYYYFLDAVGRKTSQVATVLLRIVMERIEPDQPMVFAIDDTPTKRYGPKVQGAGIHHNPTPGPAGAKFLYGHNWVVLARIVRHARFGIIGLPLLGFLYVRKKDVPNLPAKLGVTFRTKLTMAVEAIRWLGRHLARRSLPVWLVMDGFYAKREVLREAKAEGIIVIGRLRKDAAIYDLPPAPKSGQKRGRGRPPIYGKNRFSLAKRAGQQRGWTTIKVRTTTGAVVTKQIKTFLATWRPAGGVIRVVLVKEEDGSWRALYCTDPDASVEAIVQTAMDRWGIEQNFKDLKETEGIAQVQLRRYFANVGALNLNLWVHTLIELWAWARPASDLSDRSDRPWDEADRRPSHADRRKALQRTILEEEFRRLDVPKPYREKIRPLLDGIIRLAA